MFQRNKVCCRSKIIPDFEALNGFNIATATFDSMDMYTNINIYCIMRQGKVSLLLVFIRMPSVFKQKSFLKIFAKLQLKYKLGAEGLSDNFARQFWPFFVHPLSVTAVNSCDGMCE